MLVDETDKKRKYIDNVEFRQVVMIAFIEYTVWATSCSTLFQCINSVTLHKKNLSDDCSCFTDKEIEHRVVNNLLTVPKLIGGRT